VTAIDATYFPHLYSLSGFRKEPPRRFYAFELLKLNTSFRAVDKKATSNVTKIKDFRISNEKTLRSGKTIPNTGDITYLMADEAGDQQWVTGATLNNLKANFGKKFEYAQKFNLPENSHLLL
jgi:hypothetical protein